MFDTPVADITLVVVDPTHARFGQKAKLTAHAWNDDGGLHALFSDGTMEVFHDGMMSNDPLLPQADRILTRNSRKLIALQRNLPTAQEVLFAIAKVAQNNQLSLAARMEAKRSFGDTLTRLSKTQRGRKR